MSQREAINVFDIDGSYAGGSAFTDGMYRIQKSGFVYFDFNTPNNDTLCMMLELQPLVNGKPTGDTNIQYWSVMDKDKQGNRTVEPDPDSKVKGEKGLYSQIRLTESNKHDKLFKFSGFAKFMENLKKAGYDMDAAGNDITSLNGLDAEFGRVVEKAKPKSRIEEAESVPGAKPKKDEYETIVIVNIPKGGGKGGSSKAEKDDEPKAKKNNKADDPETLIMEYLEENVCTKANAKDGGVPYISQKLELSNWLAGEKKCDADTVKKAMAIFNDEDDLNKLLKTFGWTKNKKVLEPED